MVAIREYKKSLNKSIDDHITLEKFPVQAKFIIKKSKIESCQEYTN